MSMSTRSTQDVTSATFSTRTLPFTRTDSRTYWPAFTCSNANPPFSSVLVWTIC
jgi:hypothetical protein